MVALQSRRRRADTAIADWPGVTSTASGVTGLDLRDRGLRGTVAWALSDLSELNTLLVGNDNEQPQDDNDLLADCLPPGLKNVDTHDLDTSLGFCTKPRRPRDLTATASYDLSTLTWSVRLTWTAPDSPTVTGYVVKRRVNPGDFTDTSTGSTATSYVDADRIFAGTNYIYQVVAVNANGSSIPSLNFQISPQP